VSNTPVSTEELKSWFTYHSPTVGQVEQYRAIRSAGMQLADVIVGQTPAGDEQRAAVWLVRQAVMAANAAIACAPSDHG
jgi:hypothetical protein